MSDPGLWVWREDGTGTGTGDMHPATVKDVLSWLREHGMYAITSDLIASTLCGRGPLGGRKVKWCETHRVPALSVALSCPTYKLKRAAGHSVVECELIPGVLVVPLGEDA